MGYENLADYLNESRNEILSQEYSLPDTVTDSEIN